MVELAKSQNVVIPLALMNNKKRENNFQSQPIKKKMKL